MTFLRARREPATAAFWVAVAADHRGAPAALQELARGDNSVVSVPDEAEESVAWATRHPAWTWSPAPVWIETT